MKGKEKRKYRFNLFDIVIILIIVAAVGTLLYFSGIKNAFRLFAPGASQGEKHLTVHYTVELKTIRNIFAEYLLEGDEVIETVRNDRIGVIRDVEILPATAVTTDLQTGEIKLVTYPEEDFCNIRVTIEKDVAFENDTYLINGYAIAIGETVTFRTKNYVGSGICVAIDVAKEGERG